MDSLERATGLSLKLLNQLAGSKTLERMGALGPLERLLYRGTKTSVSTAVDAVKRARPVIALLKPARMKSADGSEKPRNDLFDLTLTDSQQLVRDSMQKFAKNRLRPLALEADEASEPPAGLLDEAHALGLSMLAVPEALGGAGEERSPMTNVLVAEDLARGDMSLAFAALAPVSVVHAIVDYGTAQQQGEYLPAFAGEEFYPAAIALLEARPMFDPHRLSTRASLSGDSYVLNGSKSLVPLALDAELFLVFADLAGKPQAFLVEKGAPGLTVQAEGTMGLRAAKLGSLKLDNVRVSTSAKLGGDEGIDAERLIDLARVAWAALAVGTCDAILDYVKTYCNERVAFGEPITYRQSVAFMIANIAIELDGLRLLTYRAASRAEADKSFRREATLAHVQAAEKAMQIATDGVQLLGGHGFTKEHPVELWYRQLRAIAVIEGALLV
ncbi:MAG: acyl-CoA dehydrogenase, C-terminal domain protein [Myxococcaceae bacterium]|nr:acyl-CoA dehydrogenase, C-terminal domain protein [Myxococcaceae bacterium]